MDIQAEFEKIYEVRVVVPSADSGTLLVTCEGANAVGNRYPAAMELAVIAMPEAGYEVSSVEMNGISLSGMPKEGGQIFVVIPADVTTDYIEFKVNYTLKKYRVRFIATGQGVMTVEGLPEGIRRIENTSVTNDNVAHFTQLKLSVAPETESFLVSKFIIHLPDGNQQVVTAADTTIVVTDNINIEVVFRMRDTFLFPVVFTPNGDGYNDSWKISGLWQAPDNKLEIYNRLQQRVYKVSPYMNEWEGTTNNGSVLPAGTYIYKFTTASGEEYMGFISLIRN